MSDRKVLTIYGYRGWNEADPEYCRSSIERGLESLRFYLTTTLAVGKGTIHSVSQTISPPLNNQVVIMATVVYSGANLPNVIQKTLT